MDLRRIEVSEGLWSKGGPGIIGLELGLGLEAGKASKANNYATPDRPHCCVMLQEQTAPRSQWLTAQASNIPDVTGLGSGRTVPHGPSDQWLLCHPTAVPPGWSVWPVGFLKGGWWMWAFYCFLQEGTCMPSPLIFHWPDLIIWPT